MEKRLTTPEERSSMALLSWSSFSLRTTLSRVNFRELAAMSTSIWSQRAFGGLLVQRRMASASFDFSSLSKAWLWDSLYEYELP